jgi:hypothetical protein
MQVPLAYADSAALEEVSIPLWRTLFDTVGWPPSLAPKKADGFTYDDLLDTLQRDTPNDELAQALETIDVLGTPEGREAINGVMDDRHVSLDGMPQDVGPREFAIHLFLKQREDGAVAEVFSRAQVQLQDGNTRRFNDFTGKETRRVKNAKSKVSVLEAAVRDFCLKKDLGDHAQVRVFDDDDGAVRFQIIHSYHTRTPLAVVHGSSARATIKYRPVHADLVRYEASIGRLRITARAASMVEFYRRTFGAVLFDDGTFFYGDPVCDLRALQEKGREALERHGVYGVGRVWMTECVWERGDGQRVTIQATDCFRTISEMKLDLTSGELLQAKLKMQVMGKSTRPVTVSVRVPSRIEVTQAQHELLVNNVLDAVGIRNARPANADGSIWSLYPWRHPVPVWRGVFGRDTDTLVNAGGFKTILLNAVVAPGHPGAGRVHQAEEISRGEFFGTSDVPEIPPRTLSATDLDGLELDVSAFQTHLRDLLGFSGTVVKPSDDGLVDLGALELGDHRFHLTYALRQPPPGAATVLNARANGARAVLLLPIAADEVPGIPSVVLQNPLPAKNALIRAIAAKLNLTEQLPAILTAPDAARLVVDTRRGTIWFDGRVIPDLKPNTQPFDFVELLARNASNVVSTDELLKVLSPASESDNQPVRIAKSKAKKAIADVVQGTGVHFADPFQAVRTGYRLTVPAYVL